MISEVLLFDLIHALLPQEFIKGYILITSKLMLKVIQH